LLAADIAAGGGGPGRPQDSSGRPVRRR